MSLSYSTDYSTDLSTDYTTDLSKSYKDLSNSKSYKDLSNSKSYGPSVHPVSCKKIHQTWKSHRVPNHLQEQVDSWKELNPGYEYKLWTDEDCVTFVRNEYPEFLSTYQSLRIPVMKADLFRYLVVHHHGGVYSDLDTWCKQSIDNWTMKGDCLVACVEADVDDRQRKRSKFAHNLQYCQWTFYAPKGHPTLYKLATRIKEKVEKGYDENDYLDLLNTTGPGIFTTVINEDLFREKIQIIRQESFAWTASCNGSKKDFEKEIFVMHTYEGSWKNGPMEPWIKFVIGASILSVIFLIFLFYFSVAS